ncbi:hypothetical protein NON00_00735 [Roseomonas sp. GC11]|uniref:hypothetical protein n=1 Tax=Roseomonas sp. GC11 TaxID=2950546 RepID=UPI002108A4F5|nr:hypothetical protein [Roseomonas sp. GC11]MCQ4158453.1 hypothetical protein [Roseomonas sp. GC11]
MARERGSDGVVKAEAMAGRRAVRVRGAAQARAALEVAREIGWAGPLPLLSPPGAAAWLGAAVFLAQIAAACRGENGGENGGEEGGPIPPHGPPSAAPRPAEYPSPEWPLPEWPVPWPVPWPVLDCGAAPGLALAALRHAATPAPAGAPRLQALVLDPACPAWEQVAAAAARAGLPLWPALPPALDPGPRPIPGPAERARLRHWLAGAEAKDRSGGTEAGAALTAAPGDSPTALR